MMKKIEDTEIVPEMAPCPQCGKVPEISYACGEYFIFNSSEPRYTCFCDRFTEMSSSIESEIKMWNKAVSNYEAGKRNDYR